MKTDTARLEQGAFSASSSGPNRGRSLDRSAGNSRKNSRRAPVADDGSEAETKLTSLDVLLGMLQSLLGEIRDFGGDVRLSDGANWITIQLINVTYCKNHKMMHSGPTCPMC